MSDPYIDDVIFLLHGNGDLLDTGVLGLTTDNVDARFGEVDPKFPGRKYIQGANVPTGSSLRYLLHGSPSTLFGSDLRNGDFTIEFFTRTNAWGPPLNGYVTTPDPNGRHCRLVLHTTGGAARIDYGESFYGGDTSQIHWGARHTDYAGWVDPYNLNAFTSQWQHIAYVRYGGRCFLFVDGVTAGDSPLPNIANVGTVFSGSPTIFLGADRHLCELRITKGVARYTGNFVPPTEPFPNPGDPPEESAFWMNFVGTHETTGDDLS